MTMERYRSARNIILIISTLTAFSFSFQYFMQSSFPLGGDGAYYITMANKTLSTTSLFTLQKPEFITTNYPLSHALFSLSILFPTSWPTRLIISASLIHFITALLLGWTANKFGGWPAAATAIIIWGMATTTINHHFEDGTLAQQISLIPLILFINRLFSARPWQASLALIATILTHPLTGLIAVAATIISFPPLFFIKSKLIPAEKHQVNIFALAAFTLLPIIGFIIYSKGASIVNLPPDNESVSWPNLIRSFFGPFILIAPLGLVTVMKLFKKHPSAINWILAFVSLATLSTLNNYLGIGFWTFRFQTYFIITVTLLASIALPNLTLYLLPSRPLRGFIITLIFTLTLISAWRTHQHVYSWYESPSNYGRLHYQESAAIDWLSNNVPSDSTVITSTATRHAEWIEALTKLRVKPTSSLNQDVNEVLNNPTLVETDNTYLFIFTKVEDAPPITKAKPEAFATVHENEAVQIIKLISANQP